MRLIPGQAYLYLDPHDPEAWHIGVGSPKGVYVRRLCTLTIDDARALCGDDAVRTLDDGFDGANPQPVGVTIKPKLIAPLDNPAQAGTVEA